MFSENLHEWQEFYTTTAQISTLSYVTKVLWVLQRQKFLRNNVFQIFSWVLQILLFDCSWSHKHNFRATTSGGFYSSLLVPRGPGAVSNRLQQGWIWFWDFQPNWFLASAQIFKYCTSTPCLFTLPLQSNSVVSSVFLLLHTGAVCTMRTLNPINLRIDSSHNHSFANSAQAPPCLSS